MRSKRTLFLIEVAIFAALAYLLDIIPFLSFKIWAQGGSVSLAMIPIFIVAFRWGLKGGLLSGLLWGVLQVAIGPASIYYFWQGVIEYGFAFTVLGLAGIFAKPVQRAIKDGKTKTSFLYIMLGVFIGSAFRFIAHFAAGIVFFAEFAPEGQPVWLYSLVYNCSYMVPSFIICTLVVSFLFNKQPRTLLSAA
ncbi:energy-coupled thiamine transporter ThiT [Virgibacillus ndiopensis]|uniref:energy-coupled thiamine transporter ThiT n=1 Tax=Virgibacillus ndiopensis TaxID=2004408 RepID=UPI000C08945D|nr:energy-coupled thiamine transporter ThiT [Virgibacillus ndiopensis]